jgi:hypothetical protein
MTLIGDKTRFAIEYELDPDPAGVWLNGSIKLWIGNRAVGELPSTELRSLRDYIYMFEHVVSGDGRRSNPTLFAEPMERVVSLLDDALFVGTDAALDAKAEDEQWGLLTFDLGFPADQVYAIESGDEIRLLVSGKGGPSELRLPKREVYDAFTTARDQLEDLRRRAAS